MGVLGLHSSLLGTGLDPARLEAQAEELQEWGIGVLEIPLSRPQTVEPRRLRAMAERGNLELFASLPGLPPGMDIAEQFQDAIDFLEQRLRLCAEIGSFGLGGLIYAVPGHAANAPGRAATAKEMDGLSRFLERAARGARSHGLKLAVAPASRFETHLVNRAADAAWLIERVGAENLFIHLDTFTMNVEEEGWMPAFEAAAPFIGYANLAESNRGVPGRGLLDWAAVFKAMAETGLSCPLVWRGTALRELAAGRIAQPRTEEGPDDLIQAGLAFLRAKASEAGITLRG